MENFILFLSFGLSVLTFYFGRLHGAKIEGEKIGVLLSELKNIKQDLKEFKTELKQINPEKMYVEIESLKTDLVECKDSISSLNKRIDNHLSKDHWLEKR